MAIITVALYKAWAGITDSSLDTQLALWVPQVEGVAEDYCNRKFSQATYTESLDGTGSQWLFLKNAPIGSITSIKEKDTSGTQTTLNASEYRFDPDNASRSSVCRLSSQTSYYRGETPDNPVWTRGCLNYEVVYQGGWAEGAAPASLNGALYRMIDFQRDDALRRKTGSIVGAKSESLGAYSYTLMDVGERFDEVRQLLAAFRRPSVGIC